MSYITPKRYDYRMHQLIDELNVWTAYLQTSSQRFLDEMKNFHGPDVKDLADSMELLRKEALQVRTKTRKTRNSRRAR